MAGQEFTLGGKKAYFDDPGFAAGYLHTYPAFTLPGDPPNGRTLHVFLPREYETAQARYPVIYMNDGERAFFRGGPANLSWDVPGTLNRLWRDGEIERLIVVGIAPIDRNREYTHVPWGGPGCCGLEAYARLVGEHVKGFVDAHYRTLAGPSTTMMLGSSHGGLAAFVTANLFPQAFGVIGALSPSFWVGLDLRAPQHLCRPAPEESLAASALIRMIEPVLADPSRRPRVFLQWGLERNRGPHNAEIEERATARGREMAKLLVERFGYATGTELAIVEDPQGEHNEITWGRHVPRLLRFFCGT